MKAEPGKGIDFPFVAVTGMDVAKEALVLLAVDPVLKGVLIVSPPGTGKSLLVRAFRSLLAEAEQVPVPFVEVPLGVTESRLLGGLDLERTLSTGKRQMEEGLLLRAHGGMLCIGEINLLDRRSTHHIAAALDSGVVRIEREGLKAEVPSDFALIGTYDLEEGGVSGALTDSVGIHVRESSSLSSRGRAEVLRRDAAFQHDPVAFAAEYEMETARLIGLIGRARRLLPRVAIVPEDQRRLSHAALRLCVEGHRADVFALRLARARAAIMGRITVEEDDLKAAVEFVLLPRAKALPQERVAAHMPLDEAASERAQPPGSSRGRQPTRVGAPADSERPPDEQIEALIVQPLDLRMPEGLLTLPSANSMEKGSSRTERRKRDAIEKSDGQRGRYVRAVPGPQRTGRIALEATLRAAAPHQLRRRQAARAGPGAAAIQVAAGDLRFKQFRRKAGILIIFAVDASGSMALNRIHQAKGALIRLLQEAYLYRDQVALISFHDDRAELLLAPGRSVESAKRALQSMAVGGGTPLAAGLSAALNLARSGRYRGTPGKMLVLFTDGRANVLCAEGKKPGGRQAIWEELESVGRALQDEGVGSVVIDTRHRLLAGGEAEALATVLGARYVCLPNADAGAVHDVVATLAQTVRM